MKHLVLTLGALLSTAGCAPDEAGIACVSDSDCAGGQTCNQIFGICTSNAGSVADNAVRGSFSCTLRETKQLGDVGNLVMKVAGESFSLGDAVACAINRLGDVAITLFGSGMHKSPGAAQAGAGLPELDITVAPSLLSPGTIPFGEWINTLASKPTKGTGTASFNRPDCTCAAHEGLAEVTGGTLELRQGSAAMGSIISGDLDLTLTPLADSLHFGAPCNNLAACGGRQNPEVFCLKELVEGGPGYCTAACQTDADCNKLVPNITFCSSAGVCALICTADSQCPAGMSCRADGGKKACLPVSLH